MCMCVFRCLYVCFLFRFVCVCLFLSVFVCVCMYVACVCFICKLMCMHLCLQALVSVYGRIFFFWRMFVFGFEFDVNPQETRRYGVSRLASNPDLQRNWFTRDNFYISTFTVGSSVRVREHPGAVCYVIPGLWDQIPNVWGLMLDSRGDDMLHLPATCRSTD